MRNLAEAIQILVPGGKFTVHGKRDEDGNQVYDGSGNPLFDYSRTEWIDLNGNAQPTLQELEAVQGQADALRLAGNKDIDARDLIEAKRDKALRMILKYVATLPGAPQPLKDMAAQIEVLESDLQGDD